MGRGVREESPCLPQPLIPRARSSPLIKEGEGPQALYFSTPTARPPPMKSRYARELNGASSEFIQRAGSHVSSPSQS